MIVTKEVVPIDLKFHSLLNVFYRILAMICREFPFCVTLSFFFILAIFMFILFFKQRK